MSFAVLLHGRLRCDGRSMFLALIFALVIIACQEREKTATEDAARSTSLKRVEIADSMNGVRNLLQVLEPVELPSQGARFLVLIDAKECSSCSGAGLGLRELQRQAPHSSLVLYANGFDTEISEFYKRELLKIPKRQVDVRALKAAMGNGSGGAVVRICGKDVAALRTSTRVDWPKVIDSALALPACDPASG